MLKLSHTQKPSTGLILPYIRCLHILKTKRRGQSFNIILNSYFSRAKSNNIFPKRIVDFIKQETLYIAEKFTEHEELAPNTFDKNIHETLKPSIKLEIKNCIDDYTRFVKILHYNPVDILPSIYIHYLETLKVSVDDPIRKLTVERLCHYGLYDYIWKCLINETSTINDIEEIIDEMGNSLERNNNLLVGLFRSLIASQHFVPNQSLKSVILDATCHNFSLPKDEILKALELLEAKNFTLRMPENQWEWLLVNRELLRTGQRLHDFISPSTLPGWFTFLTENTKVTSKDTFLDIIHAGKSLEINDRDLLNVLKLNVLSVNDLMKLVRENYLISLGINLSLTKLVELCIKENAEEALCEILSGYSKSVRPSVLSAALCYLHKSGSTESDHILNLVFHESFEIERVNIFGTFLKNCVPFDECSPMIHKAVISIHQTEGFPLFLRNKFTIHSEQKGEILDLYKSFIQSVPLSTKIILELMRNISIRNRIYDDSIVSTLFKKAFEKLSIIDDSFPDLKTKRKFTSTVRSFGQLVSDLDDEGINRILTCIYVCTTSHDFMKNTSLEFKFRLFQKVSEQAIRFLERKKSHEDILGIVNGLQIPSSAKLPFAYNIEVKKDPKVALRILEDHKNRKGGFTSDMVKFIERGILENREKTEFEKLKLFNEFRTNLLASGYDVHFNKNNVIIIIKMIIQASKKEDKPKLIKVIKALGKQQKLPPFVISKWVKQAESR